MRKAIAIVLVLILLFITGITLADEGEAKSTSTKGGPALNNMANWLLSHFPHREQPSATKEAAPPLTEEELRIQRENTGMGMRGIVGNE